MSNQFETDRKKIWGQAYEGVADIMSAKEAKKYADAFLSLHDKKAVVVYKNGTVTFIWE